MITKVLLYNSEHDCAEGLKALENSGVPANQLRVIVSNVEHSRLLNAETAIHIDLLSEIAAANRGQDDLIERADEGFIVPFFTPQTTLQVPLGGIPGIVQQDFEQEHGVPSLMEYGLTEETAHRCLHALRAGQCVVCIEEEANDSGLFNQLSLGFADEREQHVPDAGAAEVLINE
ncbi:hypothetical protein [Paenibacillus sp. FSL W7-1287]|uniref:hypothetical protein n=1 Tax=Paenibacillus sp. FSL W7-1287 TaxID=2954538 RepID=UPI0030F5FB2A